MTNKIDQSNASTIGPMRAVISRDLRLALAGGGDGFMVVVFFVLAAILFPFGVGPESAVLTRIGPGVIWVTALLSVQLSVERLFIADFEDGSLDQLILAPLPLEFLVIAKVIAHWLTTGLPLIIAAPVLGLLYQLPVSAYMPLIIALILGTPTLSLLGSIGTALTLGARRGGVLLSLLVLPLYIPVLIFGVGVVDAAVAGRETNALLMILGALLLGALALSPWATAAALRQAAE
jgi:heme exporter protein B